MSEHPSLEDFPPPEGAAPAPLRQRLTQERINGYAAASGDHNPIHLDADFARAAGLPSTIAHGLLTLGVACAQVERWAQGQAWTSRVSCRFSAPLPSGQIVSGTPRVIPVDADLVTVELDAVSESGDRVLSRASLELRAFPPTRPT
ncbi:MAG TPA: MaoC/PaaZ C-terminal domain-containing protein [Candidatus Dormibacteraeota bacterium]|nr:MaoC/PaaZ C-terminal domain-containing protein [Candidatus Dormibacteraeota bacterium]